MAKIMNSLGFLRILGLNIIDDSSCTYHFLHTNESEAKDDFFKQSAKAGDHSRLALQPGDENKSPCQTPTGEVDKNGWESANYQFWMPFRTHLFLHPYYTIPT